MPAGYWGQLVLTFACPSWQLLVLEMEWVAVACSLLRLHQMVQERGRVGPHAPLMAVMLLAHLEKIIPLLGQTRPHRCGVANASGSCRYKHRLLAAVFFPLSVVRVAFALHASQIVPLAWPHVSCFHLDLQKIPFFLWLGASVSVCHPETE